MKPAFSLAATLAALLLGLPTAQAQWTRQTIVLQPGWNAVHLEVQPEPADCAAAFAGLPVESVWAWNRPRDSVQFIQDPTELRVGHPDWLVYHPSQPEVTSLHYLQGGRSYLIRVSDQAAATSWNVVGTPSLRPLEWFPDSLHLTGLPVAESPSTTFSQFLQSSSAHAGQVIRHLDSSGRWQTVPANQAIRPGTAYWMGTTGGSDFQGPLRLSGMGRSGLNFGADLVELSFEISNASSTSRQVTLVPRASEPAPGSSPASAPMSVPLAFWQTSANAALHGWKPLGAPINRQLAPGETWRVRLEVLRRELPLTSDGSCLSLLEISDSLGYRRLIPVSAQRSLSSRAGSSSRLSSSEAASPHAGLWMGTVTLTAVNQPSRITNPQEPLPTAAPFQFRLIVHVDATGKARLLRKVLQMHQPATYTPDPQDPGRTIIDQPARQVLLTDDSLASDYSGATLRDGRPVARRLSSSAFGFTNPIPFSGAGSFGQGSISCNVALPYTDPLNPFQHRYHPDHDNLNERFDAPVPEGRESFTVNREIVLEFTETDPESFPMAGWGDLHLGGNYRERVTGLHRHPLHLSGTFRLHRASRVDVLNDGRTPLD